MEHYLSQAIQGVTMGGIYGLIGLSIVFIYRSTRTINFAQGEMGTASTFMCYALLNVVSPWIAVAGALLFAFLFGYAFDALVVRHMKKHSEIRSEILTIGLFAIINSVNGWIFGHDALSFPSPAGDSSVAFGEVVISHHSLWILACTMTLSALLFVLFKFTNVGLALRAIAEDPMSARLKGIHVDSLISVGWGLSSLIGGIAAMFLANSNFLYPNLMGPVLLYGFASAVIGGLTTSFGALIGGILIGVTENLAGTTSFIGAELKIVVVGVILVLFLMVRPQGLFGREAPRKV